MDTIGDRIKYLRNKKKMSLRELAKKANVSHSFIADIESGRSKPSIDTLTALARALGIAVNRLIPNTEYRSIQEVPPLTDEEEKYFMLKIKQDDKDAFLVIVEAYQHLVDKILDTVEHDEKNKPKLYIAGINSLFKAISSFEPDSDIKLSTYLSRKIEDGIKDELSKIVNEGIVDKTDNPKPEKKQNVFGEKIKRLRLERNLTINELADMTDLDPQHLADLEEGKHEPEWNAISELAEPLNISEFELAKGTPYEISQETLEKMRKQALAASEMIAQISKSLEPTMKVYQTVFKAFQESIDNILDSAEFKRFMESIQEITKAAREVQKENESINAMLPEKNENEEKKEDPE